MFLWLALTFPVYLVAALIGLFNKHACAAFSQSFVNAAFRLLMWLAGAKTTVIGKELIPKDTAVLYVSNHRSYADTPLGYMNVAGITGFIAKKEVKERLISTYHGDCAEMEGAAIAHGCYLNKIPFVIIRAISDKADDSAEMDYPTFEKAAAKHCAKLVENLIPSI